MAKTSSSLSAAHRCYGVARATRVARTPKNSKEGGGQLQGVNHLERYKGEEEDEQKGGGGNEQEDPFHRSSGPGYLPFPPPFHTINVVMILFLANVLCYLIMNFGNDDWRDFVVEHFTLSHENWTRIYPLFTNAFYQENILQLLIDCWLLWQFGDTMLGFLGNTRMTFFALLCTLGGSAIHVARQQFELYYGMDELEVRGRCYGPNPFIMGLVAIEGLIFRHLNFIQQPPIPFLVLTAFVMVIDVWRIFTTKPEEHGAATGGALMAYLFWALPTRMLGLDKLTATL
ncbi:putative Rhomboid family [Leishmania utingensis]|uniref:Rhomboid family n=1 Tax=Leishmania utingensis TaxID=653362 RepID=A0AAW3B0E4_9TRYP